MRRNSERSARIAQGLAKAEVSANRELRLRVGSVAIFGVRICAVAVAEARNLNRLGSTVGYGPRTARPGARVRDRANITGLVLGFIEANF